MSLPILAFRKTSSLRNAFLTLFILCQFGLAQVSKAQSSEELAINKLLQVTWPEAIVEGDADLLDKILNDDFEKVDALGNWSNKEDEINSSHASLVPPDSIIVEVTRIRFMGVRNALAVTRSTEVSNNEEGRYSTSYWSSHLLEIMGQDWKVLASHISGRKISRPAKHEDKF